MVLGRLLGALVSLIILFILLDVFFLGWFLIDEPVLKTIAETTGSLLLFVISKPQGKT